MIELVRDLRVINILAKFENDVRNSGLESVNGACLPCRPLARRQYPGALKGCGVKTFFQAMQFLSIIKIKRS